MRVNNADLIVLVAPGMILLHPEDEIEDGDERPDSIVVPPEHDVAKPNIVVCRHMACCNASEGGLVEVSHDDRSDAD